jgi:hypothetical protein
VTAYEPIHADRLLDTRRGYLPPTADTWTGGIDWIAVERATRGELPTHPLTEQELREAALWLRRNGAKRAAVSTQLDVYERLIREWEAEEGLLPAEDLCATDGCRRARAGRGLCALCLNAVRIQEKQQKATHAGLETAA